MSQPRLGDPVELPWWTVPLGLPPLAVAVLAAFLAAPAWAHALGIGASVVTVALLLVIATRVASRNIQSVWISALYAAWVFAVVTWAVTVATTKSCTCT